MDRGRRGSVTAEQKKRGWPPAQSVAKESGFGQMAASKKFGGEMVAPTLLRPEESALGIDPNLLVGPLYVPKTSKAAQIKQQLGDITQKLHSTLYAFDEYDDLEEEEDPLLRVMRDQIGGISDKDMQNKLNRFMDQYETMHSQVSEAHRERDEMLLQLADWFTTDHVDLDDIKSSFDDSEEEVIKQGYFDTITNFEKIKKLQQQIVMAGKQGKNTRQLQKVKHELERDVVDKFKVMKDMSMQTMKLKVSDDAPWKYAAQEIVSMLKNVRAENVDELSMITKKMQEMVDQLEKQAMTIKSLTAELREKKEVVKKLTDENSDLSQDVAILRARYNRYEKDLEAAKQMIRSLHMEKMAEMEGREPPTAQGKSLSESISKVLSVFEEPKLEVKEMSSDPALLRTQLRDYQEALDSIRAEYSRAAEEVEELQTDLEEKKEYIHSIEAENEKLTKDIRRMRQEKRQSIAAGAIAPAAGDGHQCEHCKCHVPEKDVDEEVEELKKEMKAWQDKCNYYKKVLADTEMKLSETFKEISDLRMDRDIVPVAAPVKPTSAVKPKSPEDKPEAEKSPEPKDAKKEKGSKPAPKSKPKPATRARYMDSHQQRPPSTKLPPIDKTPIEQKIEEYLPSGLTAKQSRELKLYKAGDLQGKLNMLVNEIMEFVTEIGRMLHTDKEDEGGKIQQMKAFTFDNTTVHQKQRELKDPKEEEARQNKSQVIFSGQHACSKLREAYDMLSNNLSLKHDEFEAIYRAFKISQQRNSIRREVMMGRLPMTALRDFDKQHWQMVGPDSLLGIYFNVSYGGGPASLLAKQGTRRHGSGRSRRKTSAYSVSSQESEAKLKSTMGVLGVQRSKSDLDTHEKSGFGHSDMFGEGIFRERSQLYMTSLADSTHRDSLTPGHKQEMRMGMAVVPRKGLIHLSTNDHDEHFPVDDFAIHGDRRRSSAAMPDHAPSPGVKPRSLIRRKDIMEQIRMGTKLLEDEEAQKLEEEQLTKSLGDYTILDLQSKILEMTDNKSMRRTPGMQSETTTPVPPKKKEPQAKVEKSITLPAIKNINPFNMKTK